MTLLEDGYIDNMLKLAMTDVDTISAIVEHSYDKHVNLKFPRAKSAFYFFLNY